MKRALLGKGFQKSEGFLGKEEKPRKIEATLVAKI